MAEAKVGFAPLPAPLVRPYTVREHTEIAFDPGAEAENPELKRSRRVANVVIDLARYGKAIEDHPEMEDHLSQVATAGVRMIGPYFQGVEPGQLSRHERVIAGLVSDVADGFKVNLKRSAVKAAMKEYPAPVAPVVPIEAPAA